MGGEMIRILSYSLILFYLYTGSVKAAFEYYVYDRISSVVFYDHRLGPSEEPNQLCHWADDLYQNYIAQYGGSGFSLIGVATNVYNEWDLNLLIPLACEFQQCSLSDPNDCYSMYDPIDKVPVSDPLQYSINISPIDQQIEPIGIRNSEKYSTTLNVQVKDQYGNSHNDMKVELIINMATNSGGHIHKGNNENIPDRFGEVAGQNVVEVNNSKFDFSHASELTYTASVISGVYTISASCVDVDCGTDSTNILVKVPGLEDLGTNSDWVLVGSRPEHPNNHYITDDAKTILMYLASSYRGTFPNEEPLHINDISLRYGGLFDVYGNWKSPHIEHRKGTVVDIRANMADGAIKIKNFKKFMQLAKILHVDPYLERHYENGLEIVSRRHFHTRLLGVRE